MAGLISTVSIARVRLGYIQISLLSKRFIIKLRLTHRRPSRLRKEPLSWPFMVWFQIRSLILKTLEHVSSSHIRPIYEAGKLWPGFGNNAKLVHLPSWSKTQNIYQLWFDTLSGYFGSLFSHFCVTDPQISRIIMLCAFVPSLWLSWFQLVCELLIA